MLINEWEKKKHEQHDSLRVAFVFVFGTLEINAICYSIIWFDFVIHCQCWTDKIKQTNLKWANEIKEQLQCERKNNKQFSWFVRLCRFTNRIRCKCQKSAISCAIDCYWVCGVCHDLKISFKCFLRIFFRISLFRMNRRDCVYFCFYSFIHFEHTYIFNSTDVFIKKSEVFTSFLFLFWHAKELRFLFVRVAFENFVFSKPRVWCQCDDNSNGSKDDRKDRVHA